MKVRELIEELKAIDPELEVYLQIDQEGNGYNKVRGADPDVIFVSNEEVYDASLSAEDNGFDEEEWEELKALHPKAVIIFP